MNATDIDTGIVERLSLLTAIQEALNTHVAHYHEKPTMVLLGPAEIAGLVAEMNAHGVLTAGASVLQVYEMLVVAKIGDGIDFSVSYGLLTNISASKAKSTVAQRFN